MNDKTSLGEMFKQKASFSGAVGTTYDVTGADVSVVVADPNAAIPGGMMTLSTSDKEWRRDLDDLLNTFINHGFNGNIQADERTGMGPVPTGVFIQVSQSPPQMVVLENNVEIMKVFTFEETNDLITFLAQWIRTNIPDIDLSLIQFRTSGYNVAY
jgi:hypothetical protein